MLRLLADPALADLRMLAIHVGPQVALMLMLAVELMRRRLGAEKRAQVAETQNEALRDEVWRLKEAAALAPVAKKAAVVKTTH